MVAAADPTGGVVVDDNPANAPDAVKPIGTGVGAGAAGGGPRTIGVLIGGPCITGVAIGVAVGDSCGEHCGDAGRAEAGGSGGG